MATIDTLIADVKRDVIGASYSLNITDAEIVRFASEELQNNITPFIMTMRSEYFVRKDSVPVVSGQTKYRIPYRAIGRSLRDLKYSTGTSNGVFSLPQIAIEDIHLFTASSSSPSGFYIMGDNYVVLSDSLDTAGSFEVWYALRPNSLTQSANARLVSSVGVSLGQIVLSGTAPSSWVVGTQIDIIDNVPGYETKAMDLTITNIVGPVLTVSGLTAAQGIVANNWVSIAETSPVIQLPQEAYTSLLLATCTRYLQAIDDLEAMGAVQGRLIESKRQLSQLLAPRVAGENQVVIQRNGLLRQRTGRSMARQPFRLL